jgi:hypothetical protein
MTTEEFAARKGCTARTVRRAIEAGLIPPAAVRRSGNPGRRQAVEIVDVALADRSWIPAARFPRIPTTFAPPQSEGHDVDRAWFIDVIEQEFIKGGFGMWALLLGHIAKAVMAIPQLATERIDGLPAAAADALRGLCEDALACMLPEGVLTAAIVGRIHDDAERAIVEGLLRARRGAGRNRPKARPRPRARRKQS